VIEGHELADRGTPRDFAEDEDQGQSLPGRWVNSHELLAGDIIIGRDGRRHRILGISQRFENSFPVSNLTIGEFHNYAVGPCSILVHNKTICAGGQAALQDMLQSGRMKWEEAVRAVKPYDNAAEVLKELRRALGVKGNPLKSGVDFEAQQLAQLGQAKNDTVWRPTNEQISSAAFKVIVGEAKYTPSGKPVGTILDATGDGLLEIKHGISELSSSYQLRLQAFRALAEGTPFTIRSTRPINLTFQGWLERWGVKIERI